VAATGEGFTVWVAMVTSVDVDELLSTLNSETVCVTVTADRVRVSTTLTTSVDVEDVEDAGTSVTTTVSVATPGPAEDDSAVTMTTSVAVLRVELDELLPYIARFSRSRLSAPQTSRLYTPADTAPLR